MPNRVLREVLIGVVAIASFSAAPAIAAADGEALYLLKCATCHDSPVQLRIPPRSQLRTQAPEDIVLALTTGVMSRQVRDLATDEIRAVAVFLTGKEPAAADRAGQEANLCKQEGKPVRLDGPQWNGWGRDLENSRYQPSPGLKVDEVSKLKLKWAFGYPGTKTYGQPTVVGERLYVSSLPGRVFSLNASTGCTYWSFQANSGVRTAISVAAMSSLARAAVYFGDDTTFVYSVDAASGKLLWKTKIEDHRLARITGAPVLHRDRIYVPVASFEEGVGLSDRYECCTFRGSVVALEAANGKLVWKTHTIAEVPKPTKKNSTGTQMYGPAGAAVWSAPTIDVKHKAIYVGTGNSYTDVDTQTADAVVALDLDTGRIKWASQRTARDNYLVSCGVPFGASGAPGVGNCPEAVGPDFDFGSSPILRTLPTGKQVILAGQKSGVLYALDPDDQGKVLWQAAVGRGSVLGGIEWGPAADEHNVYVAISDVIAKSGERPGGLTALKIADGKELWRVPAPDPVCSWGTTSCSRAQSAAVTAIPGAVFSGSQDGHLRAYSTKDGSVLWDFDTAKNFDGVNGVKTSGGSLDAGGPTIANGVLYVNSGYGRFVGQPGNALLAFTVDGK